MTQDLPTASELVEAVRGFLEADVLPGAEGRERFHTRVAMNVLGIVGRELELGPEVDAAERSRLLELLREGHDDGTPLALLDAELASGLRSGTVSDTDEAVLRHLRETVRDKLRIANPGYGGS